MIDPPLILNAAFWALVQPLADAADPPVICINPVETSQALEREQRRDLASFPQLTLSQTTDNLRPAVRTFGMNRSDHVTDYPMAGRLVFNVSVKTDKADLGAVSSVMALVKKALYAKYPLLNINQSGFTVTEFVFDPSRGVREVRGKGAGHEYVAPWTVNFRVRSSQVTA